MRDPPPGDVPAGPHPAPRLFALAAGIAAGVFLAEALHPAPRVAIVAGACGGAAILWSARAVPKRTGAAALAAAIALGFCLTGLRIASLDRSALGAGARAGADAMLEGAVLEEPVPLDGGGVRILLGVERAEIDARPYRTREKALLTVKPARPFTPGDRLRVDARLTPLLRPHADDPARSAAARWRRAGVSARAYAREAGIERAGRETNPLMVVARAGRSAMARAIGEMPEPHAGLLLGVTIGDKSRLDPVLAEDFRATGLSHITAVSGANVAMFLGAIAFILRALRLGRRVSLTILALAAISFMAITGFEPSVLRAGAMASVGLAGVAVGARREALTGLAVACLGLLVWDPFLVHAIGFQLSALATLGLLTLSPRLARAAGKSKLGAAAAVTLGAQLAVAPLIAFHFRSFSVVALPANLLALPGVAPATVLGFASAALAGVWAPAGRACAALTRPALGWMVWVARTFARLPAASVDLPGGLAGLLAFAGICALPVVALRARRPSRGAPIVLVVALVAATTSWARALGPPPLHGLVVTALDVGQGDAWLVRTPSGVTMLVDGGPDEARLVTKLRAHRVVRIDLLVLTHPHADHVDGLPAAARTLAVGRAISSGQEAALPALARLRETLETRGIPRDVVRRGARYALGEAEVDVLGPAALFEGTDSDVNNSSVVLRVRFGRGCVLLSGEVQEEGQEALLAHPEDLRCPVITVPHHGSRRMLPAYFAASAARVAMISVGKENTFGHPSGETLAALGQARIRVLRTDLSGTVSAAVSDDGEVAVRVERTAPRPV